MKGYRTILFDLDGTLLDTLADLEVSVNYMLKEMGFPLRRKEEVRSFLGNGVHHLVASALPKDVDADTVEKGLSLFKSHYAAHSMEKTAPYPGICDVLSELRCRGIRMGVVTNKVDAAAQPMIEHYFPGIFDVVLGQREDIPKKPAPDMLFAALKEIGVPLEHCLYVGDSEVDKSTADAAGLPCVLVAWGYRDQEDLAQLAPENLIFQPSALMACI